MNKILPGTLFKMKEEGHLHDHCILHYNHTSKFVEANQIIMYIESSYDEDGWDVHRYQYNHYFLTPDGKRTVHNCNVDIDELMENNRNSVERIDL